MQCCKRVRARAESEINPSLSFDRHASKGEVAVKARLTCGDLDDPKFIDLAVAGKALLLSQDRHILSMSKRLLTHGIRAQEAI